VSLLSRAHQALGARRASEDGYAQFHRDRDREQVVSWVTSTLECEPGEIEGLEAVAGEGESFLWRFKIEGLTFLAGVVWCEHPGPPGRNLFLGWRSGRDRGRYSWPPDVDHADQIEVPGTVRIRCLADLAEAVDQ